MFRSLRYLVLMISITGLFTENLFAFQKEIDWIWNDTKASARGGPACMNYIVKAYPIKIFRRNVSGQTCLKNSIESYRKGDQEEALGWILAGQCHNRLARETIVKHAPKVLEYVLQQYGKEVTALEFSPRKQRVFATRRWKSWNSNTCVEDGILLRRNPFAEIQYGFLKEKQCSILR